MTFAIMTKIPVLWEGFVRKICRSFFTVLYTANTLSCYLKFHYLFFRMSYKITSDCPLASRGQQVSVNPDITSLMSIILHFY